MFNGEILQLKRPQYELQTTNPASVVLPCGRCGKNIVGDKFVGVKIHGTKFDPDHVCVNCLEECE